MPDHLSSLYFAFPGDFHPSRLGPLGLVFVVLCYSRRDEPIGGWLMFFYYQIYATILFLAFGAIGSAENYLPSQWDEFGDYVIFLGAVVPRTFAFLLVGGVATVLLLRREFRWVENLRVALAVGVALTLLSVVVDVLYFTEDLLQNFMRLVMLGVWLGYFLCSERVARVFPARGDSPAGRDDPPTRASALHYSG